MCIRDRLMTDAGRRVREQFTDTGGFTDHVFAVTSLLGYRFVPRIRDLPSTRLYVFEPAAVPKELRGLLGGKIKEAQIIANWPDILRSAATMAAGIIPPSQLLRKFAAYPRQHDLALASVSYTHLDVYKRQVQGHQPIFDRGPNEGVFLQPFVSHDQPGAVPIQ